MLTITPTMLLTVDEVLLKCGVLYTKQNAEDPPRACPYQVTFYLHIVSSITV